MHSEDEKTSFQHNEQRRTSYEALEISITDDQPSSSITTGFGRL